MNGYLRDNPLAELLREISLKNLSGKLQLQLDKVIIVLYFQDGGLAYAASNLRTLRLSEYIVKANLVTEPKLRQFDPRMSDLDLAKKLVADQHLSLTDAQVIQAKQISDILRVPLLWTDGSWEFDSRSHLKEEMDLRIEVSNLLIDAIRRLPSTVVESRFTDPDEILSPATVSPDINNLSPGEGFLFSRFDGPMPFRSVLAISGQNETDTKRALYSLVMLGMVNRTHSPNALRNQETAVRAKAPAPPPTKTPDVVEVKETVESFLDRLSSATTHYQVLNVASDCNLSELKKSYYDLARKYHPDLFRHSAPTLLARIESAFARIAQAYDTLTDPGSRSTYDSKIEAQARAAKLAQEAPKATAANTTTSDSDASDYRLSREIQAENQFKEGFAALEMGQRSVALGLLSAAAKTAPNESRYRAYYGRALSLHESTRRLAEAELSAAVKLDPNNVDYKIMLAEVYRDLGLPLRARGEAERALAIDQNNRKARELLQSLTRR